VVDFHRYGRYLTFWSLKMDTSSLKSSNIRSGFLHLVSRKGDLRNRTHAYVGGKFLPISIFIIAGLSLKGKSANRGAT